MRLVSSVKPVLAARDTETGGGMTAKEVRDQVVTIFMAGHETTAQALSWTFYLLSQDPDVERRLHDEFVTVLAGRTPRYEDLAQLRYTRMAIEESMRLFPPAHTIGRLFLEASDEQEELASYLKDREAEGVKSVHFYFPNDLDASTQTTNHMVIDLAGFSGGVAAFTKRCEQAQ